MKTKKSKKNQGFSLLEMLLAAGLMSVVALGNAKILEMQNQHANKMDIKFEGNIIQQDVAETISNLTLCSANFQGKTVGDSVSSIVSSDESELFKTGENAHSLKIEDMKIVDISNAENGKKFNLGLLLNKQNGRGRGIMKKVPVYAQVDSNNVITECVENPNRPNVSQRSDMEICLGLGGTYANDEEDCQFFGDGDISQIVNNLIQNNIELSGDVARLSAELDNLKKAIPENNHGRRCRLLGGIPSGNNCNLTPNQNTCTSHGGTWGTDSNGAYSCSNARPAMCHSFGGTYENGICRAGSSNEVASTN